MGDEDVPRALLAICKGAAEPVLNVYDQLLSSGAVLSSQDLRLRLLRSVLAVLREWSMSAQAEKSGTARLMSSHFLGGKFQMGQVTGGLNQGVQDKITSAANRSVTSLYFSFYWKDVLIRYSN